METLKLSTISCFEHTDYVQLYKCNLLAYFSNLFVITSFK